MDCVDGSQDRERWQAVVYTVTKLGVPYSTGGSRLAEILKKYSATWSLLVS